MGDMHFRLIRVESSLSINSESFGRLVSNSRVSSTLVSFRKDKADGEKGVVGLKYGVWVSVELWKHVLV